MAQWHTTTIDRGDDQIDVEVEFTVTHYGTRPSWDDPGEGPEIELGPAARLDGEAIDLSEAEAACIVSEIVERPAYFDRDPFDG